MSSHQHHEPIFQSRVQPSQSYASFKQPSNQQVKPTQPFAQSAIQPLKSLVSPSQPFFQQSGIQSSSLTNPKLQHQHTFQPISQPSNHRNFLGQLNCQQHQGEQCKRICAAIGCTKKILLCAECFYEDPDHIKNHKDQIMPIPDFLNRIDNIHRSFVSQSSQVQSNIPIIIHDLTKNDQHYVKFLQGNLNDERQKLRTDFQRITTQVLGMLEKAFDGVQNELDHHYSAITQSLVDFQGMVNTNLQHNPREAAERMINAGQQQELRAIRDQALNKQYQRGSLESQNNVSRCAYIAEHIKKFIMFPPSYSPINIEMSSEFTDKLQITLKELTQRMIENISLPPAEDDIVQQGMFQNYQLSEDNLSAKLPVRDILMLSNQPSALNTYHQAPLNCIKAIEPNMIVSGGMDGVAMIWNIDNGELVTTLQGHKGPITSLGCTKSKFNDQTITFAITGSVDKNVILWNIDDEDDTLVFKGHQETVTAIISFEDLTYIATGSADRKIIVWDTVNQKMDSILPCNGSIYALHKLKAGGGKNYFLSSDHSQALNVYKIDYGSQRNQQRLIITLERVILTPCLIYSITSSYINPLLIVGSCSDKSSKVWNLNFNQDSKKFQGEHIIKEFIGHKDGVLESIIIDTIDSTPTSPDYFIISIGAHEDRIIVRHSKTQQVTYHSFQGLNISETFTNYKMQIMKNSRNEYKLAAIGCAQGNQQIFLWDIDEGQQVNYYQ